MSKMVFRHLQQKRIGYVRHACRAFYYSLQSLKASLVFAAHAIYPDVLETTGSETIIGLYELFEEQHKKEDKQE